MTPRWTAVIVAGTLAVGLCGCGQRDQPLPSPVASPSPSPTGRPLTPEEVEAANVLLRQAAQQARAAKASMSFEDFKKSVYKEPFEGGKYIVDGDTPLLDDKRLKEFFERRVKPPQRARLIVDQVDGMDNVWGADQKQRITYCVSRTFAGRYDAVVRDMDAAGHEWEKSAAVDFVHDSTQDSNCGAGNQAVVFDVRPVNVGGEYLARAFFPNEPRAARNVLVDESALTLPAGNLQLVGVLRHELGHTLGFRHEHTRPDSGDCFEDSSWRPLTSYDAFSVMHYPQCNGRGDWTLNLTDKDRNGAACLYGPAAGFTVSPTVVSDPSKCSQAQPDGQPRTRSFPNEMVAKNGQKRYGPFAVKPGSTFSASIGGAGASGDPDLYVRFNVAPSVELHSYDCRPYFDGPSESCSLVAPNDATNAHVMVHGYRAGRYQLDVSHVPPAQ